MMDDRRGYILLSRKITTSDIFHKPPLYLKVWIYLLSYAQYKDYKGLKKGQLWVSIDKIREDLCWYVGYRKVMPTRDEIYNVIEWLRFCGESNDESDKKAMMITTTRATRGLLVNIENYAYYQDAKNYENNDEDNNENVTKAMTKVDRDQHDKVNSIKHETNKQLKDLKPLSESDEWFKEFWNIYPKKVQRKTSEQKFKLYIKDEETFKTIIKDVQLRSKTYDWTKENGQYVPNPTTYLNQRRWEDELPKQTAPNKRVDIVPDYSKNTFTESGREYDEAMASVNALKEKELTEADKQRIISKMQSLGNRERE